jgi:hypothetical protein
MDDPNQKIVTASKRLDQMQFPELLRPAVGQDDPPTDELVFWGARMYCFSTLAHFREMLRSFLNVAQNGLQPAGFIVARCLFELGAHSYYTHKHTTQYLDAGDIKRAWEFLKEINLGSRYISEEYGEKSEEWSPFTAPREIAKVIRVFNEWTNGKATTEYSFLSEFAHPAFSHYYEMEPRRDGFGTVRFHHGRVHMLRGHTFRFRWLLAYNLLPGS